MRILVVEDDLEAQRYLVNGLKEAGHVVDEAADGDTGLALALSRPYDCAIIDRMLPQMDGLKVVAEMREHGNLMPVLFLSALSEVDDRVKGLTRCFSHRGSGARCCCQRFSPGTSWAGFNWPRSIDRKARELPIAFP